MKVTPSSVRRIEHILDASGAVEILASGLRTDNRGRKQNTKAIRLLLLGVFISVHHNGSGTVTDAYDTLVGLCLDDRLRLGISVPDPSAPDGTTLDVTLNQLYYVSKRITERLAYGEESAPDLTDEERTRRHDVVRRFGQAVMDVFDLGWNASHAAMDATGVWSWGRGKARPKGDPTTEEQDLLDRVEGSDDSAEDQDGAPASARPEHNEPFDLDAAWGIKTSKTGDPERFFGYHEHTLLQIPGPDATVDDVPPLIRAFELTPANRDVVDVSLRVIDAGGQHVTDLAVDTHYSYKLADRWKGPLHDRGIRQHLDLRSTDQGFTESDRVRWAAGWAHCPATPDALGTIEPPPLTAVNRKEKLEEFHQQINHRESYAFRRVTSPDRAGTARYECPAEAGKLGCPLRAGTVETAVEAGLPIVERPPDPNGPEGLPTCCAQRTLTLTPPPGHDKLVQPHYWGGRAWHRIYGKRTYVEGSYGNRKNPSTEDLRRGLFRVVGLPWVHINMTAVNASYNLRILRNWHERTGRGPENHPLLTADPDRNNIVYLTDDEARARVATHHAA